MTTLVLENGKVLFETGEIKEATLICQDGKITEIIENSECNGLNIDDAEYIDCSGKYVFPGFIDIHVHGGGGEDSNKATIEAFQTISKAQLKNGTTSIVLAISGGFSDDNIKQCAETLNTVRNHLDGANILGLHLEGPFVSTKKRGAISPLNLCDPSIDKAEGFLADKDNLFKIITLAPELPNSLELIDYLISKKIIVALGHSEANYATTKQALEHGASHFTHIWNAMTQPAPRDPGMLIPALAEDDCYIEIIADGYHVHKENVIFTVRTKPIDKICLITDAIEVTGTELTEFFFEGVGKIEVHDGRTWGPGGAIMGSILTQDKAVRNIKEWTDLSIAEIVQMVTKNPAKELGIFPTKGCISVNSDADFVVMDSDLTVQATIIGGSLKYKK